MSKGYGLDFVQTPEIVRRYSFRVLPLTIVNTSSSVQHLRLLASDTTASDRFFILNTYGVRNVAATGNAVGVIAQVASSWGLDQMHSFVVSGSNTNPGNNAAVLAYQKGYLPFVDVPVSYAFTGGVDIDLYANYTSNTYILAALSNSIQYEALIALIV